MSKQKKEIVVKKENIQREQNKSLSEDLLVSYRSALYKVKNFFDSIDKYNMGDDMSETMKVVQSILSAGEKLGKNIETLAVLEKKVASEELSRSKVRGNADIGMFE